MSYDFPKEIPPPLTYEMEFDVCLRGDETISLARQLFGSRFGWGGWGEVSRAWLGEALILINDYRQTHLGRGEKATATRLEKAIQSQYKDKTNWYNRRRNEVIQSLRQYANYEPDTNQNADWELGDNYGSVCINFLGGESYGVQIKLTLEDNKPKVTYSIVFGEFPSNSIEELAEALKPQVLERRAIRIEKMTERREKAIAILTEDGISLTEEVA